MLIHVSRCVHCKSAVDETDADPAHDSPSIEDDVLVGHILCPKCGRSEVMRLYAERKVI